MDGFRVDGLMDVVRQLRPTGYADPTSPYSLPAFLYETDGLAAVIVDKPAEDAVSSGFDIHGDEEETVLNELDRLDATIHLTNAIRWARLEGASAILMLTEDGAPLDMPLDYGRLKLIQDFVVYPGSMIHAETERYIDPRFTNYGLPVRYRLTPERGDSFIVHESRLVKFTGDPLPRQSRLMLPLPWQGRSSLEACREDIYRYRRGLKLSMQIMERKQQAVHSMNGLAELLATDAGIAEVRNKIALTDSVRGVLNSVTIDGGPGNGIGEGDKYNIIDLSLSGIREVLNEYRDAVAASSRMPQTILFGSDVKGLGSTGSGEQSIYHSLIKSIRERQLRPAMEHLAGAIWAQSAVPGIEPQKWRLEFKPLWSPTEKEVADVESQKANARKTSIEAVEVMMATNLISPEEGREAVSMVYPELNLNISAVPVMPDEPEDTEQGRKV